MKRLVNAMSLRGCAAGLMAGFLVTGIGGCGSGSAKPPATAAAPAPATRYDPTKVKHKLVVEGGDTFNFGTTEVGQEFEHVFVVKNVGDTEVSITKGPASCVTCTSFNIDKAKLKPNESLKATVKWRIGSENPEFRQYAPLMLDNGDSVKLYVTGQVAQRIVVSPSQQWNIGDVVEGKPKEFQATITSGLLEKFDIESTTATQQALKITSTPISPEKLATLKLKSGFDLTATLDPSIPIGDFKDTVTIKVLDPKPISIKLDVTAKRAGPLEIFGPNWNNEIMSLGLGGFNPREELITRLVLATRGVPGDLQFVKVNCKDPRVTVELKPDARFKEQGAGDYKRYELLFKVAASDRPFVYSRQEPLLLEIETNLPQVGTIKLNLRAQATLQ